MFCRKCGHEVNEGDKICYNCGADLDPREPQFNRSNNNVVEDQGSIGWAILGFFFPLIGLILFCVWNKDKPKSAKQAGIGALIGFICGIVFGIAYGICIVAIVGSYPELQAINCFIGL